MSRLVEQLEDCRLALAPEDPRAIERSFLVEGKRRGQSSVDRLLFAFEHPRERHDERGVRWNLHQRRLEVPVRVLGLLDARVRVHEAPGPFLVVHERARLRLAGRQRVRLKRAPSLASDRVFTRVVALLADAVECGAERVARWLAADRPVPAGVVPGNACGQVEHYHLLSMRLAIDLDGNSAL